MGARGPAPKRSSQRRRKNKTEPVTKAVSGGAPVYGRELEGDHSDQALRFWGALRASGQAQFYEESDWAAAELVVLAIDSFVRKPSAMMFASIQSGMSSLLVTEGDRRRARLELERPEPGEGEKDAAPAVTALDEYRRRLAN